MDTVMCSKVLSVNMLELRLVEREPTENTTAMLTYLLDQISPRQFDSRHGERLAFVPWQNELEPARHSSTIVQLLDVTRLHLDGHFNACGQNRHLHQLIIFTWSCPLLLEELVQPRQIEVRPASYYQLYLMLDGELDLQPCHGFRQNNLAVAFSAQDFCQVLEQSKLLGEGLEMAMEFGLRVSMGRTQQQKEIHMASFNRAACLKTLFWYFCRDATWTVAPLSSLADVVLQAKDTSIARLPNVLAVSNDRQTDQTDDMLFDDSD